MVEEKLARQSVWATTFSKSAVLNIAAYKFDIGQVYVFATDFILPEHLKYFVKIC